MWKCKTAKARLRTAHPSHPPGVARAVGGYISPAQQQNFVSEPLRHAKSQWELVWGLGTVKSPHANSAFTSFLSPNFQAVKHVVVNYNNASALTKGYFVTRAV